MQSLGRVFRLLFAIVMLSTLSVAYAPAAPACACGAVPMRDPGARIAGETGLIVWDGKTERIDMVMAMTGSSKEAAWIMPTPADTELALGDKKVWPKLRELTKPEHRTYWDWTPLLGGMSGNSAVAGAKSGVHIDKVTEIGPFQVTTLSGDAASVNTWLTEQHYGARPELTPTFQSYLDQGWKIQAVRLTPAAQNAEFKGSLDPLRMTFTTDRPVYPIKLSQHAKQSQSVDLNIIAPHRMDIATQAAAKNPLELYFAGRVPAAEVGVSPLIAGSQEVYLTRYVGELYPANITEDFIFAQSASDAPHREIIWEADRTPGTILGLLLVLAVLALSVAAIAGIVYAGVTAVSRRNSR